VPLCYFLGLIFNCEVLISPVFDLVMNFAI